MGQDATTTLRMIARVLDARVEVEEMLRLALGFVVEATRAERGFLVLLGAGGDYDVHATVHLEDEDIASPRFQVSHGLIARAVRDRETVLLADAQADEESSEFPSVFAIGLLSALVVPIPRPGVAPPGRPLGVIYLDHRTKPGRFGAGDRALVESAAAELGRRIPSVPRVRPPAGRRILGRSAAVEDLHALIDRIGPTELPVLIEGESGVGKELVARAIHEQGPRAGGPFVALNCAALSENLLEAELFGAKRGAYTGADADRAGLFAQAHGGTLFLDEVAETSPKMQAELLRVLEERKVRPVGSAELVPVDVRILSAANRRLLDLCEAGRFRHDLYYRLAVMKVEIPPLRDRRDDVPLLAAHFLEAIDPAATFTDEALGRLLAHGWPGNVRELKHVVERSRVLAGGQAIGAGAIVLDGAPAGGTDPSEVVDLALLDRYPGLTVRHLRLYGYVQAKQAVDAREVGDAVGVSRATALRDLGKLVELGLVRKVGQGRAIRYVPESGRAPTIFDP